MDGAQYSGNVYTPLLAELLNDEFDHSDNENRCDSGAGNSSLAPPTIHYERSPPPGAVKVAKTALMTDHSTIRIGSAAPVESVAAPPTAAAASVAQCEDENLLTAVSDASDKSPPKVFQCAACPFGTSVVSAFQDHQRIHTGEKPFACVICDYECNVVSNLKRHVHTKHKDHSIALPFRCTLCNFHTPDTSYLRQHIQHCTHSEKISQGKKPMERRKSLPNPQIYRILEPWPSNIIIQRMPAAKATRPAPSPQQQAFTMKRVASPMPREELPAAKKFKTPQPVPQLSLLKPEPMPPKPQLSLLKPEPMPLKPQLSLLKPEPMLPKPDPVLIALPPKEWHQEPKLRDNPNFMSFKKKRFYCQACEFKTKSEKIWQQHLHELHQELRCPVCKKQFSSGHVLEIHIDIRHSVPTSSPMASETGDIDVRAIKSTNLKNKQYFCKLCGFGTLQPYELDKHEQRHIDAGGFQADQRMTFEIIDLHGDIISEHVSYKQQGKSNE